MAIGEQKIELSLPSYFLEIVQKTDKQVALAKEIYAQLGKGSVLDQAMLLQLQSLESIAIRMDKHQKILEEIRDKESPPIQGSNPKGVIPTYTGSISDTKDAMVDAFKTSGSEASQGNFLAALGQVGAGLLGLFATFELLHSKADDVRAAFKFLEPLIRKVGGGWLIDMPKKIPQYVKDKMPNSWSNGYTGKHVKKVNSSPMAEKIKKIGADGGTDRPAWSGEGLPSRRERRNSRSTFSSFPKLPNLGSYISQLIGVTGALDGMAEGQKRLNLVMKANLLFLMVEACILLYQNIDLVKDVLTKFWAAVREYAPDAAKTIEDCVRSIIEKISAVKGIYDSIVNRLSKGGGTAPADVKSNARGGIVMSPILTTFAEEGPEAAIPLDGTPRAISLWYTAGRMLGMFDGQQPALASSLPALGQGATGQGVTISAPITITINGNADYNTAQQVQQAAQAALTDLKRQIKELQWQERRLSFG